MAENTTKEACVWNLGTPCGGETEDRKIFKKQIKVPMCESHLEQHKVILLLFNNGYEVEEILNQTPEWRQQEALTITLSGLSKLEDVEQ